MKYALVMAALFSIVFAGEECYKGTRIDVYSDDECTQLIEDAGKVLNAEEAA